MAKNTKPQRCEYMIAQTWTIYDKRCERNATTKLGKKCYCKQHAKIEQSFIAWFKKLPMKVSKVGGR